VNYKLADFLAWMDATYGFFMTGWIMLMVSFTAVAKITPG